MQKFSIDEYKKWLLVRNEKVDQSIYQLVYKATKESVYLYEAGKVGYGSSDSEVECELDDQFILKYKEWLKDPWIIDEPETALLFEEIYEITKRSLGVNATERLSYGITDIETGES